MFVGFVTQLCSPSNVFVWSVPCVRVMSKFAIKGIVVPLIPFNLSLF